MSAPPASELLRWSGAATAIGGLAIAAFVLSHPWDRFVGAEVARTGQWRVAHTLHFAGATLSLLGLVGLYLVQRERLGRLGVAGFVVAFAGTAMFVGTGMLTAFVWPMLADQAPAVIAEDGAMFDAPALLALGLTAAAVSVGYAALGIAMWRAGLLPRDGTATYAVGAILGMAPPQPLGAMPWAGLVLGGVLYGLGGTRLGLAVWRRGDAGRRSAGAPAAGAPGAATGRVP